MRFSHVIEADEKDLAVGNILRRKNLTYYCSYVGKYSNDENWQYLKFNCQFDNYKFDFRKGLAYLVKRGEYKIKMSKDDKFDISYNKHFNILFKYNDYNVIIGVKPAELIYSLILDMDLCNGTFNDFCDNLALSNDSFNAFNLYQDCCKQSEKFRKVFDFDEIEQLRVILENY